VGSAHTRKDARALPPAGGQVTRYFTNVGADIIRPFFRIGNISKFIVTKNHNGHIFSN